MRNRNLLLQPEQLLDGLLPYLTLPESEERVMTEIPCEADCNLRILAHLVLNVHLATLFVLLLS
jgi:hypothetical protein